MKGMHVILLGVFFPLFFLLLQLPEANYYMEKYVCGFHTQCMVVSISTSQNNNGEHNCGGNETPEVNRLGGGGARGEARPPTCESPIQSAPLAYVTQETRKVRAGEL